jgi:hypothetical protein
MPYRDDNSMNFPLFSSALDRRMRRASGSFTAYFTSTTLYKKARRRAGVSSKRLGKQWIW